MLLLVCDPTPDLLYGKKVVTSSVRINDSFSLELDVNYSCDDGYLFYPPEQSDWSCLGRGKWSNSIPPRCLDCEINVSTKLSVF